MLQKVCPQLINELQILLNKCDRSDVASQLPKVLVVPQEISGTPEDCFFLAYPVPRLTFEQRHAMELVDRESVSLQINLDNRVIIDLNDF